MTDFLLLEKVYKMIAGVSKPRLLYKKGICLKGFFRPYMSMKEYTIASAFTDVDEAVPVSVRFSSMLGDCGTADTRRNIKCMAVKFHNSYDEFDIISHNIPVFFINNEKTLEELTDALTCRTAFDRINSEKIWQLAVDHPESVNCILRLFSHEGINGSFILSKWYCLYTYIWKGNDEKKFLVRYRWLPISDNNDFNQYHRRTMSRLSAEFMAGFEPDTAHEQIEEAVNEGRFPAFELQVQMVDYKYVSHPDYTKQTLCWNENIYKPVSVGVMKLTEVLGSGGKDCEKMCFAPGNVTEGVELYRDDLMDLIDYACRITAVERGAAE